MNIAIMVHAFVTTHEHEITDHNEPSELIEAPDLEERTRQALKDLECQIIELDGSERVVGPPGNQAEIYTVEHIGDVTSVRLTETRLMLTCSVTCDAVRAD